MNKRRYPGVYSYTSEQKDLFFGRDDDIKELLTLIKVKPHLLLYAKSGIGKTSLLNAGIIPMLPDDFHAINIRFFAFNPESDISPIEKTLNIIKNIDVEVEKHHTLIDEIIENENTDKTLWFCLKKLSLINENKTYLIIFDQFEQLFSYPEAQINAYKQQLSELLNQKLPDYYANLIDENNHLSKEDQLKLYKPSKIKIVFAIRSDRLSLLNRLSDKIQNIQQIYYELRPLSREQAIMAIRKPAKTKNGDFESPDFKFEPDAVDEILNALTENGKQNLETTQLQIVCQCIEENIVASQNKIVTKNDIPNFQDIFLDFYQNAINKTSADQQILAQEFIEDQLIRNNQRISLDERVCMDYVYENTLKTLVDTHLLRSERNSTGNLSYELSHDTLIQPILSSKKLREVQKHDGLSKKAFQEKIRLEKLLDEKTKEIQTQNIEIKKQNDILMESIFYSKEIVDALLTPIDYLAKIIPEFCLFFKPKYLVGGDFFWMKKIDQKIYLAVADSTGYGFPGAMLSIIGMGLLRNLFKDKQHQDADVVLNILRNELIDILKQREKEIYIKDGIDMALAIIDTENLILQFSSAYIRAYIIRNRELIALKNDRIPIGLYGIDRSYSKKEFQLEKNDTLFLFTDGYADQFGGQESLKYGLKRFKKLILGIQDKIMYEQEEILAKEFDDWKGDNEQTDDLLILGIKILF